MSYTPEENAANAARYQAKLAARAAGTVEVVVTPAKPTPDFGSGDERLRAKMERHVTEAKAKAAAPALDKAKAGKPEEAETAAADPESKRTDDRPSPIRPKSPKY